MYDLTANGGKTPLLALVDLDGNRTRYEVMTGANGVRKLEVCFIDIATDQLTKCQVAAAWQVVTPESVQNPQRIFLRFPSADPFQLKSTILQTGSPYLADEQPRVTIVFQSAEVGSTSSPENISVQTSIVSRVYAR